MAGNVYIARCPSTAFTAARTLVQIVAGAAPLEILSAKVMQFSKTSTEFLDIQILRKTAAATVTSFTPLKLETLAPTSLVVGGTTATGYNATGEGTDGDVLDEDSFNVLNGSLLFLPVPEDRIWVPPTGILALKNLTTPAASMNIAAYIRFREVRG